MLPGAATEVRPSPEDPLENERRKRIYDAVLDNPGVHLRELQRMTGMRWGSLQYHAWRLRATGQLVAARCAGRTVLACDRHGLRAEQLEALHFLRGERARRLAALLREDLAFTQQDLADRGGVGFRLVNAYLQTFSAFGLVRADDGRPRRYRGTEALRGMLAVLEGPGERMPPAR